MNAGPHTWAPMSPPAGVVSEKMLFGPSCTKTNATHAPTMAAVTQASRRQCPIERRARPGSAASRWKGPGGSMARAR